MWPYLQSQTGLQAGLCERSIAILEDSAEKDELNKQ